MSNLNHATLSVMVGADDTTKAGVICLLCLMTELPSCGAGSFPALWNHPPFVT